MMFLRRGAAAPSDDESAPAPPMVMACRHCGHVEPSDGVALISRTDRDDSDDAAALAPFLTPHLRHDPTLPRTSRVPCVSRACSARPPLAIYVRYDDVRLRYLYHCMHCGAFWKSGEDAPIVSAAPTTRS